MRQGNYYGCSEKENTKHLRKGKVMREQGWGGSKGTYWQKTLEKTSEKAQQRKKGVSLQLSLHEYSIPSLLTF